MGIFGKLLKTAATNVAKKSLEDAYMDCPVCGSKVNYSIVDDAFICSNCGTNALEYDEDGDLDFDDDDSDIPEGCAACGGPYPQCTSSCKLFDD